MKKNKLIPKGLWGLKNPLEFSVLRQPTKIAYDSNGNPVIDGGGLPEVVIETPAYTPSTFLGELSLRFDLSDPKVIDTLSTLLGEPYLSAADLGRDLNRYKYGEATTKDLIENASHFIPTREWLKLVPKKTKGIILEKGLDNYKIALDKLNALYNLIVYGTRAADNYNDGFSQYTK